MAARGGPKTQKKQRSARLSRCYEIGGRREGEAPPEPPTVPNTTTATLANPFNRMNNSEPAPLQNRTLTRGG